jgi:hypothetical protein
MAPMVIEIDADVAALFDERRIEMDDVRNAIANAEATGNAFLDRITGHRIACYRPSTVTYWVDYGIEGNRVKVFGAYSHRMQIVEGFNMPSTKSRGRSDDRWCMKCDLPLEFVTVKLTYLDETFGVDLPACPSCQRVFVSEEDAVQKMALAEKMLEDK